MDTTFTLTATNSAGDTITATRKITISAPVATAPTINSFTVKATGSAGAGTNVVNLPAGGGSVTFISSVTGATSLKIDPGAVVVAPVSGETVVAAPVTGTYTLTTTNATDSVTKTVTVNIAATALAPVLTSSLPDNAATGVALNNNTIVVNSDKAMDTALTQGAFSGVTAPNFV